MKYYGLDTHVCTGTCTHQQPHYPSFRRELCFVPLESDSDLWRKGVTLHPDTHSNTKQGYWPKHGHKERLLLHQQSHTDSSACCGLGSTPHQCSPRDEFSRPTKLMHWPLSITCFDEFHEYESLCFLTQWLLNDSSGNCMRLRKSKNPDVTLSPSLFVSFRSNFLLHHCSFVKAMNPAWPDTPCLSVQVCPLQCQAVLFSLSAWACQILFISPISYSSGEDTTFLLTHYECWEPKTAVELVISNNFSLTVGFGTHTCRRCRRKTDSQGNTFSTQQPQSFSATLCKIHSGC